jgi:hypothetical protein
LEQDTRSHTPTQSKHMTRVYIKYWLAYCISIGVQMIYTHSLTRARDSVYSHVTQIHSRDRGKPGKYAGWQLLQLVAVKRKASVGRREETVSQTLAANAAPSRVRQCECARVTVCVGAFPVKQYFNRAHINRRRHENAGKHVKKCERRLYI